MKFLVRLWFDLFECCLRLNFMGVCGIEATVVLYATFRNSGGLCIASVIRCTVFVDKASLGIHPALSP